MHTTELYSKGLVEFVGAELWIWRADYKIICDIKPSITAEALEFRRTVTGWNK